jgi:hypothetical protein
VQHLVLQGILQAADIRPPALLERLRDLSLREAAARFPRDTRRQSPCPGCNSEVTTREFLSGDFTYHSCNTCDSLFVKDRPGPAELREYYHSSEAARLRQEYLTDETAAARFRHLIQSRVDWVDQVVNRQAPGSGLVLADLGTVYPGLFAELQGLGVFTALHSVHSHPFVVDRLPQGVSATAPAPRTAGVITAFEHFDHESDPLALLLEARELLAPEGLLLLTARTCSGFDLQVLWDRSPYIFVPEHLNLLSIDGMTRLLHRAGFEITELSTPGQLDLELVRDAVARDPSIHPPRFVRELLARDPRAHEDFQGFLQKHRLSSHVRIAARLRT